MARIYVIAGAPGVGKSSAAHQFVPTGLDILDIDFFARVYKNNGNADYKFLANAKYRSLLSHCLFSKLDFAIELNLGFQEHYDHLRSIKNFDLNNDIIVVLFHTDDVELCVSRAKTRYLYGGHHVDEQIIRQMHHNVCDLLRKNRTLLSGVRMVNASSDGINEVSLEYDFKNKKSLPTLPLPNWIKREFKELIPDLSPQIKRLPRRNPLPPPDDPDEPKKSRGRRR